jgi:Holliday junction resolvase RusA-like endonuclease
MIISENLLKELESLNVEIENVLQNNSLTDLQIESFFRNFEKRRYNILSEIKLHNKHVEYEYEKIKTIDNEYKAELMEDILKIYVPETMPGYKNLKTHTYKRILLNVAEITKKFKGAFKGQVFIFIKVFENIDGWDIDNKYIKPIADALISSGVIQDDNISKMFYCAKGEFSDNPHTEIYVIDSKNINDFLEKSIIKKYGFFKDF